MSMEQFSFFDIENETQEKNCDTEINATHKCKHINSFKVGKNFHLCDEAIDCSHCHIEDMLEFYINNHILKRCNVFYCKNVNSGYDLNDYKFHSKCSITGNKWSGSAYNYREDYNTNPIFTPCKTCDLVSCDLCIFKKEVTEENPYGCCGSCVNRKYCPESKAKKVELSKDDFISETKVTIKNIEKYTRLILNKSNCRNFKGYFYGSEIPRSYIKCACSGETLKSDIYSAICSKDYENCPLYKKEDENAQKI